MVQLPPVPELLKAPVVLEELVVLLEDQAASAYDLTGR